MNKWVANVLGLAGLGALLCVSWAAYETGSAVAENRAAIRVAAAGAQKALDPNGPDLPTLFNEARDITIAILKPCKPGKPDTCGLIPAVRSVAVSAGGAVDAMKNQVNQTQPLIENAAKAIASTSEHADKAIDAAAGATLQAQTDLATLNGTIAAGQPLLETYKRSGDDLNEILEQKAIKKILDHAAGVLESSDGIAADGKKITDKLTVDFLAPQPWWKKAGRYAGDAFDYGALFARHAP
jgi:hypothetical protein